MGGISAARTLYRLVDDNDWKLKPTQGSPLPKKNILASSLRNLQDVLRSNFGQELQAEAEAAAAAKDVEF